MLIDSKLEFLDDDAIGNTARSAWHPLGDVIDMGKKWIPGIRSKPAWFGIMITTACAGASTINVEVALCEDDGLSSGNIQNKSMVATFGSMAVATYSLGKTFFMPLPLISKIDGSPIERERYLQVCVKKGTTTAGKLSAFFTWEPEGWVGFEEGKR